MKHFDPYDPLAIIHDDEGWLLSARKREIRNILKSYTGYYDPFAELLQNALDAVEKRAHDEDSNYLPEVWITIDIENKQFSVTDNGCGMEFSEFQMFLKPNYSFKSGTQYRGMKGVGATYLAYGFNDLHVSTKKNGNSWTGRISGGREWVEDATNEVCIPMFEMTAELPHAPFADIDNGTSVTIRLVGDTIRPKNLTWAGASNAKEWLALLRVHTPIGAIYIEPDQPYFQIRINLTVIDQNGTVTRDSIDNPEYIYPHVEPEFDPSINLREYYGWLNERARKGVSPGKSKLYSELTAFWITGNAADILENAALFPVRLNDNERALVKELDVRIYYFMCYTAGLWDNLKNRLGLHKRAQLLHGGLQIATRHMPQGPRLPIKLDRMLGFQNMTHIVVHIDAEPDLGRKGFQPEHVELANTLAKQLVAQYGKRYRWELLRRNIGPASAIKELKLESWKEEQREYEVKHPLLDIDPKVFQPLDHLPTLSEPQVEQDVVALFNQMLSAGILRGIYMLSASQIEQYDGLYRVILESPYANYVYDPNTNPLGVVQGSLGNEENRFRSAIKVLEFKFNLDYLFEELSIQDKDPNTLDLVVAWEIGEKWKESYDLTSCLRSANIKYRQFHGYTHRFENPNAGTVVFNAIILKDLISYLNDPAAEEKRQALLEDQY